jgi:hypothetical protein
MIRISEADLHSGNTFYSHDIFGSNPVVEVQIHIFLTSALVGGEWSASRPGRFTLGKRAPCTHWIGSLDDVEKRKFLTLPGLELRPLGRLAPSQSLYWSLTK